MFPWGIIRIAIDGMSDAGHGSLAGEGRSSRRRAARSGNGLDWQGEFFLIQWLPHPLFAVCD